MSLPPDPYPNDFYEIDWSIDPAINEAKPANIEWHEKFKKVFESGATRIILSGGVGSGKTLAGVKIFLEWLMAEPRGARGLITCFSEESVRPNILDAILRLGYDYSSSGRSITIQGRHIDFRSLLNITSQKLIRGMNYACWYADEITEQKRSGVEQALQRIRVANDRRVRWIWTTNPDSQDHWVYSDFIMNPDVYHASFSTFDNLKNLAHDYIRGLPYAEGTSDYRRSVLGEWCGNDDAPFSAVKRVEHAGGYDYLFMDPALGGGDYTAVALLDTSTGHILGRSWRKSWFDCMPEIQELFRARECQYFVYEKNSIGDALYIMVRQGDFPGIGPRAVDYYTSSMNKAMKILRLQSLISTGDIAISADSDAEFVRQIVNWTPEKSRGAGEDHDDAPDVIASGLLYLGVI